MATTPTQIPMGTVASRIRSFEGNLGNEPTELNNKITSADISSTTANVVQLHEPVSPLPNDVSGLTPIEELGSDFDDSKLYSGPLPTPTSTRPPSSLAATYSRQHLSSTRIGASHPLSRTFDGLSELATVRSQLRCIPERDTSQDPNSGSKESVLSELDHLIQNAIDKQPDGSLKRSSMPQRAPSLNRKPNISSAISPRAQIPNGKTIEDPYELEGNDNPCEIDAVNNSTSIPHSELKSVDSESEYVVSLDNFHKNGPNTHPNSDTASTSAARGGRSVPSVPSVAIHNPFCMPPSSKGRHFSPRKPLFPRYRSHSVDKPGTLAQMHRRDRRSDQTGRPSTKDQIFSSRPSSSHSMTAENKEDRHILPLILPRIAETRRLGPATHQAADSVQHWFSQCPVENTMKNARIADIQVCEQAEFEHTSPATETELPCTSVDAQSCEIQIGKPTQKKLSIVESKIQSLLAAAEGNQKKASAETKRTTKPYSVRQTLLKENIRGAYDLGVETLPNYQVPINDQEKMFQASNSQQTPRKSKIHLDEATSSANRNYRNQASPAPLRSQSRQVRESLSPRGSTYSFEQRFAISPSRSRSRNTQNAVRVSVELRRSPDRSETDDQLLYVRASVEPEGSDGAGG